MLCSGLIKLEPPGILTTKEPRKKAIAITLPGKKNLHAKAFQNVLLLHSVTPLNAADMFEYTVNIRKRERRLSKGKYKDESNQAPG